MAYKPNSVSVSDTQDANISDNFDYDARRSVIIKNWNANNISDSDALSQLNTLDQIKDSQASGLSKFLKDPNMMSNVTGLASTLVQAAALPTILKNAKLQNKSLQFNLDTAKAEQARRNNNISAFNQFRA